MKYKATLDYNLRYSLPSTFDQETFVVWRFLGQSKAWLCLALAKSSSNSPHRPNAPKLSKCSPDGNSPTEWSSVRITTPTNTIKECFKRGGSVRVGGGNGAATTTTPELPVVDCLTLSHQCAIHDFHFNVLSNSPLQCPSSYLET